MVAIKQFTYEIFDEGGSAQGVVQNLSSNDPKQVAIEPQPEVVEAIPPAPTFSAEELEVAKNLAKSEGYDEGFAAAKKQFEEAQKEKDEKLNELYSKLAEQIKNIEGQVEGRKNLLTTDFANLALTLAKQICNNLPEDVVLQQTESYIKQSLMQFDEGQKIKLVLSPKNAAALNDKFTGIALTSSDELKDGDFRIEWQNGYLEHDMQSLTASMEEVLNKYFKNNN